MVNQRDLVGVILCGVYESFVNYGRSVAGKASELVLPGDLRGRLIDDTTDRAVEIEQGTGGSAGSVGEPVKRSDLGDVFRDTTEKYGEGGSSNESGGQGTGGNTGEGGAGGGETRG